jgi:hypothetical protein
MHESVEVHEDSSDVLRGIASGARTGPNTFLFIYPAQYPLWVRNGI